MGHYASMGRKHKSDFLCRDEERGKKEGGGVYVYVRLEGRDASSAV